MPVIRCESVMPNLCWAFHFHLEVIMIRVLVLFLTCLFPVIVFGQIPFPPLPQPITAFSFEDKDWSVEAPTTPKEPV